jgi:chaperonin cofactor prefoldin
MATLNRIMAEQVKLISGAKAALEVAQKKPPTVAATIAVRESTILDLKERIANLTEAKATLTAKLDHQIEVYQAQISALEKQIEEDKKRFGDQPTPPRQPKRKEKEK